MKKSVFIYIFVLLLIGSFAYAQKNSTRKNNNPAKPDIKSATGIKPLSATFYRDSARFSVEPLALNTKQAEVCATFFKHGFFYAAAVGKSPPDFRSLEMKRKPRFSIYYIPHPDSVDQEQEIQLALQNASRHNFGMPFYAPQSDRVWFTLSRPATEKISLWHKLMNNVSEKVSIYEANVNTNIWFNLKEVFPGERNYSMAHPTISADGNVLYFSSDMPGGYGGSDLYVSYRENDEWTAPVNLGGVINSPANEIFPFIHEEGNLYYASDREGGMGGFDIYEGIRGGEGFSRIANLGAPVNSSYDDFALILNQPKRTGYFTSDRPGAYGHYDIYKLDVKLLNISRNLTDGGSNVFGTMDIEISGQVIDSITSQPVKRALVKIRDFNNDDIKVAFADNKGKYKFVISNENKFQIAASKIGYHSTTDYQFSTYGIMNDSPLSIDILMSPVTYSLALNITVSEKAAEGTGFAIAGAQLQLKDLATGKTTEKRTDAQGNYRFTLEQNKNYSLVISKDGYQSSLTYKLSTMNKTTAEVLELNVALAKLEQAVSDHFLIKAIVKDRITKKPLAGTPVLLRNMQTKEVLSKTTDQDGMAVFEADTNSSYLLESVKERYQLDNYVQVMPRGMRTGLVMEAVMMMKPINHPPVPLDFNIGPIYYMPGKTTFDNEIKKQLDQVYESLLKYKSVRISIIAHTDNIGGKEANQVLSQKRATAVFNYLTSKGLPRTRMIDIRGVGDTQPVVNCENDDCTEEQLKRNRRTEIVIVER